ncbi:MAG TPA: hypothetical protein VMS00_10810 [Acidimicrobiales bacterium]|nr:hypothetical protein [Acidimicrobiales bacterium]
MAARASSWAFAGIRPLKRARIGDDTAEVTVGPGPGPTEPFAQAWQADVSQAEGRGTGRGTGAPWDPLATPAAPTAKRPLDLAESSALAQQSSWGTPAWQERQRWIPWLRLWALVKIASLSYSTWWALGYLHEKLATQVCVYGAMCLYAAVRSHWSGRRFRLFGPGMSIEPEFYEEIGRWLYRVGVVLVLCGGAVFLAQGVLGTSTTAKDQHHRRPAPAAPAAGTNGSPAQLGQLIYVHRGKNGLAGDDRRLAPRAPRAPRARRAPLALD